MVVKLAELAAPPESALFGSTKIGVPVQLWSAGPKSWNVTVPLGLNPPDTVAVSLIAVPTGPPAEGFVVMEGVAFETVTLFAAVLFAVFGSMSSELAAPVAVAVPAPVVLVTVVTVNCWNFGRLLTLHPTLPFAPIEQLPCVVVTELKVMLEVRVTVRPTFVALFVFPLTYLTANS